MLYKREGQADAGYIVRSFAVVVKQELEQLLVINNLILVIPFPSNFSLHFLPVSILLVVLLC